MDVSVQPPHMTNPSAAMNFFDTMNPSSRGSVLPVQLGAQQEASQLEF